GVGGIDVALLVVAADEGIMPQTEEHLAILDLLRVRSGVVALTKSDLVDGDWLDLVREEVAERLFATTLASAPIIPCSVVTGAGLPEILAALDRALDAQSARDELRDIGRARLPIDRVFTITGFGTVVTGTLQHGTLRVGQEIEIQPGGQRGRIRGLQTHKQSVTEGSPGARLAVNIASVERSAITRGDVVTLPGQFRPTAAMDVRIELLSNAARPLTHNTMLDLYLGAVETPVRVLLLDRDEIRPCEAGWAQLRLARPLIAAWSDRFILRAPSPSATIGGGSVVEPWARRHKRRDAATLARLERLAQGNPEEVALAALLPAERTGARTIGFGGRETAEIARATGLGAQDLEAALATLVERRQATQVGPFYYATARWERLRAASAALLGAYHQQHPLRRGMPREEWRARLSLAPREAQEVISTLLTRGELAEGMEAEGSGQGRSGLLRLPDHTPRFTPEQERAIASLLRTFHAQPFSPPSRAEAEQVIGTEAVVALVERGDLLRMNGEILLERVAYQEAVRRIVAHLCAHGRISVAEGRDLLATSRKYMLAIFERLDERRITMRDGDERILGPSATQATDPDD
ncbi:MAG TPA: SelB C-terminal domain-containing protein, partial [Ktedonobacterales bacterium]|nr:SelB C-terminal domain-containing protein [Ktedonobacterales bacterium]